MAFMFLCETIDVNSWRASVPRLSRCCHIPIYHYLYVCVLLLAKLIHADLCPLGYVLMRVFFQFALPRHRPGPHGRYAVN
jgi:hypothetical protein